ncbi:MAG TPA: YbjN domain-containing protein [Mycobacteriales bacterium]
MTQPTDVTVPPAPDPAAAPAPPPADPAADPAAGGAPPPPPGAAGQEDRTLNLRRTLRTATSESFDLVDGDAQRIGSLVCVYGDGAVEGLFAVPEGTDAEMVRGLLGWVTDMLSLDAAAGPGGQIHWVVSVGPLEDFWRRSPGRRASGAEEDVAATRAKVEAVLRQMFPEVMELTDGGYAVDAGSVRVFVQARLVDTAPMVKVFSITNVELPAAPEGLAEFLLALNFQIGLGRFSLDAANRAVWCDHVLTADELDDVTLARAIAAVASTADRYDDEIKARFGGRTFREQGSPVEQVPGAPGMAGGYL